MTTQVTPVKKDDSEQKMVMGVGLGILQNYAGQFMGNKNKSSGVSGSNPRDRALYKMQNEGGNP